MSKIIGNSVGTTMLRPDWAETNEKSSAYIENKPTASDGNFLVGDNKGSLVEMTPDEVLSHINGASVTTMTSEEFEALSDDEVNANTLYLLTDSEEASGDAVLYTEQSLTKEQKLQARNNIGIGETIVDTLATLDIISTITDNDGSLAENDGTLLVTRNDDIFLPEVSADNNGDVLKVVDGKWVADTIDIPEAEYPVTSVNGKTGDIQIEVPSIEGLATETYVDESVANINALIGDKSVSDQIDEAIAEIPAVEIPVTSVNGMTGDVVIEAGGVTSWNDLKDKPFGTEGTRVVAEWDGNTEGREFFTNYALYKVSDLVPAMSDMVGVKYVYKYSYDKTVEHTFAEDDMVQFNGYYIIQDVMIVIENDNSTLSNDTLSTGIYVIIRADDSLCHDCAYYITSMTIADTTITFDGVTAEENVVYLKDDISIFGNEVEYYYKISDAAPTLADWESTNAIATTFMGNQFCLWGFIQEWTAETQTTEIIPCPFIGVFGVYGSMTNANNKKLSHGIYVKKGIKKIAYGDYTTQKIDTDYYLTDLIVYGYPFVDGSTVLDPSHMFSDINEAFKSGRTVVFTDINHIVANRGVYYYLQDVEIDNYYHFTSHTGKYTHDIYVYADDTWEYKVTMSNDISWHELANRPFYTEISDDTEVLFENQNFSVREQRGMTVCNLPDGTTLTAGDVYIVVVNGTEYTLTAAEADYHGYASVYLGDFSIANEFNTSPEVDVCVLYIVEMNATMLIVPGSLETITASLYKGTEIVHTLNEKFIPDSIARVENIPEIHYPVTSVNGMTGDVEIVIPEQKDITVNGVAPDENGNIEVEVGGDVSSWNDLTDKPFYEEGSGATIEWDGSTEGRDSFVAGFMFDVPFYKVSDLLPTKEELIGATVTLETTTTVSENSFAMADETATIAEAFAVVYGTAFSFAGTEYTVSSPGIYFPNMGDIHATLLTYGSTTIKTIDEKFIPDTIARVDDITAPKTELILTSSTSGSSKKFKITIDDEGVLTATEIVESAT